MYPKKSNPLPSSPFTNYEYEKRKLALFGKFTKALKMKHSKLFLSYEYDDKDLQRDLHLFLTESLVMSTDIKKSFLYAEKNILESLINYKKKLAPVGNYQDMSPCELSSPHIPAVTASQNTPQIASHQDPYISLIDKREKLDELKNIKEKDIWAMLIKQDCLQFEEEEKQKKDIERIKKKQVSEMLKKQISDKNVNQKKMIESDKKYLDYLIDDYQEWVKKTELKKQQEESKIKEMIDMRSSFKQIKDEAKLEIKQQNIIEDQKILEKISIDNLKDQETIRQKREKEKLLFKQQIEDKETKQISRKIKHDNEIEEEKKVLQDYDKLMEKQELENMQLKKKISEKAVVQELRQRLMANVKETENKLKMENEKKYIKDKEEIDKRNKNIELLKLIKKKDLMEEVKHSVELQRREAIQKESEKKMIEKDFDCQVKRSFEVYLNHEREELRKKKKERLSYKNYLEKQIESNKLIKRLPMSNNHLFDE